MDGTGEAHAVPWIVAGQRLRRCGVHRVTGLGVDEDEVGGGADLDAPGRGPASPAMRAGAVGHAVGEAGEVEGAGADHRVVDDGEGGLEPEHAEGRVDEGVLLVVTRVRCVVGRDGVDGAVGERGPQRLDVLGRAQRRVDLEGRVVAAEPVLGEEQVVRA